MWIVYHVTPTKMIPHDTLLPCTHYVIEQKIKRKNEELRVKGGEGGVVWPPPHLGAGGQTTPT